MIIFALYCMHEPSSAGIHARGLIGQALGDQGQRGRGGRDHRSPRQAADGTEVGAAIAGAPWSARRVMKEEIRWRDDMLEVMRENTWHPRSAEQRATLDGIPEVVLLLSLLRTAGRDGEKGSAPG